MVAGPEEQWVRVRAEYGRVAGQGGCCSGSGCCSNDYSAAELEGIPQDALLGLGSGNPLRFAELRPGETVVDLGSGGGIDVFLASPQVGRDGRVIGVDMTPEMILRAHNVAELGRFTNVEFRLGMIEALPLDDEMADAVVSNCVINLSPDKPRVFREAFRILRPGGRLVISDVVRERDLSPLKDDCGCVATAVLRDAYLADISSAGFRESRIRSDRPWRTGPSGTEASAITIVAWKPRRR